MTMLPSSPFHAFLAKLTSRSVLNNEEKHAVLSLPAKASQIQTNHDLVRIGQRVTHSCLVIEGLVGRATQNRDGGRQIVAIHIPGDMANLHSVVAPDATSALQALAVTTIVQVPHSDLRAIASRFPAIAEAFWRECVLDAAVLSEWAMNVGRRDARSRTAHLLCEMAYRYDQVKIGESFGFTFPVTQMQLADVLALTPVHVNRVLKSLREDGIVEVRNRWVVVHDWVRMTSAGEFDPSYLRIGDTSNSEGCVAVAA